MRHWFLALALSVFLPAAAHAQANDKIPAFSDIIERYIPDGYEVLLNTGLYNRLVVHMVPKGEDAETWTKRLSFVGRGDSQPRNKLNPVAFELLGNFLEECPHHTSNWLGDEANTSYVRTDFAVTCKRLSNDEELARIRIFLTQSGTYMLSYHERGDAGYIDATVAKGGKAFWDKAQTMLDTYTLCDVGRTVCEYDLDVLGTDSQRETDKFLRCRNDKAFDCNPKAFLALYPKDKSRIVEGMEPAALGVNMADDDITNRETADLTLKWARNWLAKGVPYAVVILRPSDEPNHHVDMHLRKQVQAFFHTVGETSLADKLTDGFNVELVNFH